MDDIFRLPPDWLDTTLRLVTATILAAAIGFEREIRNKPAGLRTHMLVGLGSAAFTLFTIGMVNEWNQLSLQGENDGLRFDPLRIVEGVIGGIGFLGAGAIIQSRGDVQGITTAAGIWIAGAIGIGCGTGNYFTVLATTAIALICLVPIRFLENKMNAHRKHEPSEPVKNPESEQGSTEEA